MSNSWVLSALTFHNSHFVKLYIMVSTISMMDQPFFPVGGS